MSNEIQIWEKLGNPLEAMDRLGQEIYDSRMFKTGSVGAAKMLAFACLAKRRDPFEIRDKVHVGEDGLTGKSEAILAKFQTRGGRVKWIRYDDACASANFTHPDFCPEPLLFSISWDEIKDKGFVKSKSGALKTNYQDSRQQMLRARVITNAIRMIDPASCMGFFDVGEVPDEEAPTMGAAPAAERPPSSTPAAGELKIVEAEIVSTDLAEPKAVENQDADPVVKASIEEGNMALNEYLDALKALGKSEDDALIICKKQLGNHGIKHLKNATEEDIAKLISSLKTLTQEIKK